MTTAAPTTIPPTTLVPTTSLDTDIYIDPIEIFVTVNGYRHDYPPAEIDPSKNRTYTIDPIEISISIEGEAGNVGIDLDPIDISVDIVSSGMDEGVTISASPIDMLVGIFPVIDPFLIGRNKCNFVKWSKIGVLDFTIDESNVAGERPLDWKGCVYSVIKLGNRVVAYGTNGVSILTPSDVHYGMDTIYRIGLKNRGACAGNDDYHFFVDKLGQLFKITDKLLKLDYSEYISQMSDVILTLDVEKELLYICDGSIGYVYGIATNSFGEGPSKITGMGSQSGNLYVVAPTTIVTPKLEICTDIYDLGTRNFKTIREIEVGSNLTDHLYMSIDYRNSYVEEFRQIGWFLVNPNGVAHPKCYGVEFRFRLKSIVYEYFEVDYLKIKGHIHGWQGFTYEKEGPV